MWSVLPYYDLHRWSIERLKWMSASELTVTSVQWDVAVHALEPEGAARA